MCPSSLDVVEVQRSVDNSFAVVNVQQRTCSCRKWQELRYPCVHACAAIYFRREDPMAYISRYYAISELKAVYQPVPIPVGITTLLNDNTEPPVAKPMRGRPRKIRIRSRSEYLAEASPVHCCECGKAGHNVTTCKVRRLQQSSGV